MKTINDAVNHIVTKLQKITEPAEAHNYAWLIINFLKNYTKADLILKGDEPLTSLERRFINNSLHKLILSEPIQYVLSRAYFMDIPLFVNQSVLIPRPETEELVAWVIGEINEKPVSILDIGTGSGCIACAIKKFATTAKIDAWDISNAALKIAQVNAKLNNLDIQFKQLDILKYQYLNPTLYDIIISNPPYVTVAEKRFMRRNVLKYEPHVALFVPNDTPFLFYEKISDLATKSLNSGGKLFFEINEKYGQEVTEILNSKGFENIQLRKDISGKDRMIMGEFVMNNVDSVLEI
ncbi:MAG: peptide chain release factor N(5)-glutamine methyltransferase [Marinilabiliaceae bacterium]|nr:peptide chain release factor N(5)-glutamine methyltransferase [Marinilabiliaceae bacterium]